MTTRQEFSPSRQWIRVLLFPALVGYLLFASLLDRNPLVALAIGTPVGIILGIYGFRHTKLERTSEGLFYTPHSYFGIGLAILFALSLVLRYVHLYIHSDSNEGPAELVNDALTMLVFGTLTGNNVAYAIGLLIWRFRNEEPAPSTGSQH